jgi:hypothetical protein
VLVDNQRMLAAAGDFPLGNGDTPAITLKLCTKSVPAQKS